MRTVQLNYIVETGLQNPVLMATKVAAIPVDQEFEFLNLDKVGDATTPGAGLVTRAITLQTNSESDAMFPTNDELEAATTALLSGVLALQAPGRVTALAPIVS
jgi:hypothetical protein